MRFLEERKIGFHTRTALVPIVVGAVIFDKTAGRPSERPGADAGYQACLAASNQRLEQGASGAGAGATVAKIGSHGAAAKGGLGSASERLGGGVVVGALAVVNAVGEIIDPADGSVLAGRKSEDGQHQPALEYLRERHRVSIESGENTTLVVVATNAKLSRDEAHRLATMAHAGLSRTIRPSHTPMDGDSVFVLATGSVRGDADLLALGAFGAVAVERSVMRAVVRTA
jgi:L-aminopeptidase/D-esterase-like protein